MSTAIVGAGLSGLIAGHVLPNAALFERNERGQMHNALLRFRSDIVSTVTGIPFQEVTVRKGIFCNTSFHYPSINLCNAYTMKVLGTVTGDRSIWDIDPCQRWIAPPDFYDRMVDKLDREKRIHFNSTIELHNLAPNTISTAPLPSLMPALGIENPGIIFEYMPIRTLRLKLDNFRDVHQTIYFPNLGHGLYRASITDDTLICEFTKTTEDELLWLPELTRAFCLIQENVDQIKNALADAEMDPLIKTQKYGKIIPIASSVRHALLLSISAQFGIYSLGRFATWRNILLDDVVHDIHRIQEMLTSDEYTAKIQRTKKHASHLN